MPKPRAIDKIPADVLAEAYQALDARESTTSVWHRLIQPCGVSERRWQEIARAHRERRAVEALQSVVAACEVLSPLWVRAVLKAFALTTWSRLRTSHRYRKLPDSDIDRLTAEHVKSIWPGNAQAGPTTIRGWRRRYRELVDIDDTAHALAQLLGLKLETKNEVNHAQERRER